MGKVVQKAGPNDWSGVVPEDIDPEITEQDRAIFADVVRTELTGQQRERIVAVSRTFPRQKSVMAVHWHPEFVPMPLIEQRIASMFPAAGERLVIPTQHNAITVFQGLAGVEVDCYAKGFNQKVQLLLHFSEDKLNRADRLRAMLAHTFKYRSSQLFDFLHTLTKPVDERINTAARETGAGADLIRFAMIHARKISRLLDEQADTVPVEMIKNKIVSNFFDRLRATYDDALIDRVQTFLKAVKALVKQKFPLRYFYRAKEVVEEARALGAGIVVPHPEQFWPILLADYDVDGYEVWNPQSRRYTEFLIDVINRKNRAAGNSRNRLLIFMGDDTHMGEKVRDPAFQDPEKANREIGYQQAWDDMSIRKALIRTDTNRSAVIAEYRGRLGAES